MVAYKSVSGSRSDRVETERVVGNTSTKGKQRERERERPKWGGGRDEGVREGRKAAALLLEASQSEQERQERGGRGESGGGSGGGRGGRGEAPCSQKNLRVPRIQPQIQDTRDRSRQGSSLNFKDLSLRGHDREATPVNKAASASIGSTRTWDKQGQGQTQVTSRITH
jgi:hypothetical protein